MGVLARTDAKQIAAIVADLPVHPVYDLVKRPETGTIMLEGRAGGAGRRFNLGEATMTRCVVRLEDGTLGYSYALGRDRKKAEDAALLDAVLQTHAAADELIARFIAPLAAEQLASKEEASRKAAATKVSFFTLVRGDG